MHNPPHPGKVLKNKLIDATGLTITQAAQALGVQVLLYQKLFMRDLTLVPRWLFVYL